MSVERFIKQHEVHYKQALSEVRSGQKRSHWMWFIFPQIKGLGSSYTAQEYGINGISEAVEYMEDPILSGNMRELCNALMALESSNAYRIFGDPDYLKLCSSMTLFMIACPEEPLFKQVIDKFYKGEPDRRTIEILKNRGELPV